MASPYAIRSQPDRMVIRHMLARAKPEAATSARDASTEKKVDAKSSDALTAAAIIAELRPEVAALRLRAERLRQRYG
jgi:hypothetical protein